MHLIKEERLHASILQAAQNSKSADDFKAKLYQIVPPFSAGKLIERLQHLQKSLKRLPQVKFLSRRTTESLLMHLQPSAAGIVSAFTHVHNFLEQAPCYTSNGVFTTNHPGNPAYAGHVKLPPAKIHTLSTYQAIVCTK